jgi:gamma-glutamyltranspeptidase
VVERAIRGNGWPLALGGARVTRPDGPWTERPPARATRAMVAAPHSLATAAGLCVLRRGGSAVDAAIATNAVLAVVYPHWSGLGGDGFWMIAPPGHPTPLGINASGPAAGEATRDGYRERGFETMPERGALAALTVPGVADGWRVAHERFGRLGWDELLADAIHYARDGAPLGRSPVFWIALRQRELRERPELGRRFLPGGRAPREGEPLVLPELAASLERIARDGPRAMYEGELPERICGALRPQGSPLVPDDFAAFRAEWVEPISTTYRGDTVFELPPNTQGFAALQILNLIEGFDVASWGDGTADYYHHLTEAIKVAFADRDAWLSDPRFVDIPLERFLEGVMNSGLLCRA